MPTSAGVRRALDAQVERALSGGPPTVAQERWYLACWLTAWVLSCALIALGRALRRS
jgi:hypothetical protein